MSTSIGCFQFSLKKKKSKVCQDLALKESRSGMIDDLLLEQQQLNPGHSAEVIGFDDLEAFNDSAVTSYYLTKTVLKSLLVIQ